MSLARFVLFSLLFTGVASSAVAGLRTFKSEAEPHTFGTFVPMTYVRDCKPAAERLDCSRQEISVSLEKTKYKFDSNEIPLNKNGVHKATLEKVYLVEVNDEGGDGHYYFMLRFIPHDPANVSIIGKNGQMVPRFYTVITDGNLRPVRGMRLSQNGAADSWLEHQRKLAAKKTDASVIVTEHLAVPFE